MGNWLTDEQALSLWQSPDDARMKGKRDRALLALLLACGLRRHEAANLRVEDLQQREEHWAIVDLVGKGRHLRTVPMPDWVCTELLGRLRSAAIDRGKVFRRVSRTGRVLTEGVGEKAIWHVVRASASKVGSRPLHRTIYAEPAPGSAGMRAANWIGSSFCSATSRFRRRSSTWDPDNGFGRQSTMRIGIEPPQGETGVYPETGSPQDKTGVGSYRGADDGVRPGKTRRDGSGAAMAGVSGSRPSMENARLGSDGTPPRQGIHLRPEVQSEVGGLQRRGRTPGARTL